MCDIEGCIGSVSARGLCHRHYMRWRRNGDPLTTRAEVNGSPFPHKVDRYVTKRDGCWIWNGFRNPQGYGRTTINGRALQAHRAAYEAYVAPIPDGMEIDHLCSVRACVNPDHLEPVTRAENNRRAAQRRASIVVKIPEYLEE